MNKISTCLWFDSNAEEAVEFYKSVFSDFKVTNIAKYGENQMRTAGTVMLINFELFGNQYLALNGGPIFEFSQAISFVVNCDNQVEIDYYWDKLGAEGTIQECGWLIDKFGISWQIVPKDLGEIMHTGDTEKSQRVMQEILKMKKLDIETLRNA